MQDVYDAHYATLHVRVSNKAACHLYKDTLGYECVLSAGHALNWLETLCPLDDPPGYMQTSQFPEYGRSDARRELYFSTTPSPESAQPVIFSTVARGRLYLLPVLLRLINLSPSPHFLTEPLQ